MAEKGTTKKLSDKLKALFSKNRNAPGKGAYPAKFEQTAFKAGQKTRNLLTGKKKVDVFSKSKDLVTANAAKKLRKLGKISKVAKLARIATPIGLGTVAAQAIYQTANPSKEAKAKIKAAKKKMSKITTKQAHADLLKNSAKTGKMMTKKFNIGGETMLKGKQKKLDKDGDGKISGNDFKMMKKVAGGAAIKGMGAARTSGMGLQDENLIPGKSMDYYKDIV